MWWAVSWLGHPGKSVRVVADGAAAKAPVLKPLRTLAATVVRGLRKDSAPWTVPGPRVRHRPGPNRGYEEQGIDLAERAGQRRGWATGTFTLDGKATAKRYKTVLSTWRPAGGAIRVVLVDEPTGWASVGAFHVCLWTFTPTEAWAWGPDADGLVGHRRAYPRADDSRRPSHADKRRAWRREWLAEQIHTVLRPGLTETEIRTATERLLDLAA